MSFQAYLDALEAKTGKTPRELLTEAEDRGFDGRTKAGVVADWLREDYAVGRGHAMAFFHVLKNGPTISSVRRPWRSGPATAARRAFARRRAR
jgi:hypothetical protein